MTKTNALCTAILALSGGLLLLIGATILADPIAYQAGLGVDLPRHATLLSDLRAMGGGLLGFGLLLCLGAWQPTLRATAAIAGATLYLGYGLARLLSLAVDGRPAEALIVSAAIELSVGAALAGVGAGRVGSRRAPQAPSAPRMARASVSTLSSNG